MVVTLGYGRGLGIWGVRLWRFQVGGAACAVLGF